MQEQNKGKAWIFFIIIAVLTVAIVGYGSFDNAIITQLMIENRPALDNLTNVNITNVTDGDIIFYDNSTGQWINGNTSVDIETVFGEMFGNTLTNITIDTKDVYVNITGLTCGDNSNVNCSNNVLTIQNAGYYSVTGQFSFSDGANTEFHLALGINGIRQLHCHSQRKIGTGGDVGSASFTCIDYFNKSDKLTVMIENVDNTNNPLIHSINLNIVGIAGSLTSNSLWEDISGVATYYGNVNIGGALTVPEINNIDSLKFNTSYTGSTEEGEVNWNNDVSALEYGLAGGNVIIQIGQESVIRVKNKLGFQVDEGKVVYINGAQGEIATIGLADYTDSDTFHILGIATENIANNGNGFITVTGEIHDLDTTGTPMGESWNEGDKLYLNSNGNLSNTHPTSPSTATVVVGTATKIDSTEGIILVSTPDSFTLGNNFNGTLRQSVINKNNGTSAAVGFTAVNNLGYFTTMGIAGSNNAVFPNSTSIYYSPGYGEHWMAIDGNKCFVWFADPTDSHNNNALNYEIMRLCPTGNLNISGDVNINNNDINNVNTLRVTTIDGTDSPPINLEHSIDGTGYSITTTDLETTNLGIIGFSGIITMGGEVLGETYEITTTDATNDRWNLISADDPYDDTDISISFTKGSPSSGGLPPTPAKKPHFSPTSDLGVHLGDANYRWDEGYIKTLDVDDLYYDTLNPKSPHIVCPDDWCEVTFGGQSRKSLWIQKDENWNILNIEYNDNYYTKQAFWNLVQGTNKEGMALELNKKVNMLKDKKACKNQGYMWDGECYDIIKSQTTYFAATEATSVKEVIRINSTCIRLNRDLVEEEYTCKETQETGRTVTKVQFKDNCGWNEEESYYCYTRELK